MRHTLAITTLTLGLLSGTLALAQSAPATDPLYQAFGEKAGIASLMDDFVTRLRADPRIGAQFKDVKPAHLKTQLTDQICKVAGGPCVYEGEPMKKSHEGLKINTGDFNRLVEVLQDAMDAKQIPFSAQNQLLARLAPMHTDIITVK